MTGSEHWPPDMKRNFGSSLTIASPAVGRKSLNMISTTGRRPVTDIPIATPTNPFSQIGVFVDPAGELLGQPVVRLEDAAVVGDVLAQQIDRRIRRHLVVQSAALMASR